MQCGEFHVFGLSVFNVSVVSSKFETRGFQLPLFVLLQRFLSDWFAGIVRTVPLEGFTTLKILAPACGKKVSK